MHLDSRCSSSAGAVSSPALVVSRLHSCSGETVDIGVGQESAGPGLQSVHVGSSIVEGPGEARSIARIIDIGGTQLGTVLPGVNQALENGQINDINNYWFIHGKGWMTKLIDYDIKIPH